MGSKNSCGQATNVGGNILTPLYLKPGETDKDQWILPMCHPGKMAGRHILLFYDNCSFHHKCQPFFVSML